MKPSVILLLVVLLFIQFRPGPVQAARDESTVMLTAEQVDGANDIEAAIETATAGGTRPGTVLLDGRHGAFLLTDLDRSLNIMVSNLTLRGIYQARIENCDDGLFFDNLALQHILVEDLAFFCTGDGIESASAIQDVTIRGNLFQSGASGVTASGAARGWQITGNTFLAGGPGLMLQNAADFTISGNHISGFNGIHLAAAVNCQIRDNVIDAAYQGILLYHEAWRNKVQANTIYNVAQAGIALEPGVTSNLIVANQVFCAAESDCLAVDALPDVQELNRIAGNRP